MKLHIVCFGVILVAALCSVSCTSVSAQTQTQAAPPLEYDAILDASLGVLCPIAPRLDFMAVASAEQSFFKELDQHSEKAAIQKRLLDDYQSLASSSIRSDRPLVALTEGRASSEIGPMMRDALKRQEIERLKVLTKLDWLLSLAKIIVEIKPPDYKPAILPLLLDTIGDSKLSEVRRSGAGIILARGFVHGDIDPRSIKELQDVLTREKSYDQRRILLGGLAVYGNGEARVFLLDLQENRHYADVRKNIEYAIFSLEYGLAKDDPAKEKVLTSVVKANCSMLSKGWALRLIKEDRRKSLIGVLDDRIEVLGTTPSKGHSERKVIKRTLAALRADPNPKGEKANP